MNDNKSKKNTSQYKTERYKLRKEYTELLITSLSIISTLDIRDKRGQIIEYGYSIIESILNMERQHKDITEQIKIISQSKWTELKNIWDRMRVIENQDKCLISKLI